MEEAPIPETTARNLRFLRILVTTLTATMIVGLLAIVVLLVIRFTSPAANLQVPDSITLPDGTTATAFTQGTDWYAVVTSSEEILIFDRATGELRQTIRIAR